MAVSNIEATLRAPDVLESARSLKVLTPDPASICDYLADHPGMEALLSDVLEQAAAEFTGDQLSLEVYRDPETPDCFLALFVRQSNYAQDLVGRASAVMDHYADRLASTSGWLQVTTDFQLPR
jgi:hypothetical protein